MGHGGKWKPPDEIISSEYLTLEGKRISTSRNHAIWVKDLVDDYHPDSIRYFLVSNGPEKRDGDFSWREFINSHNGELLGAWGNFVNRSLVFVHKYFEGKVPQGELLPEIEAQIIRLFSHVGNLIEKGHLKQALDDVFVFVRYCNKYFDGEKPWETRQTDLPHCANTLFNCVQMIANLAILLQPFVPFSSKQVQEWLELSGKWAVSSVPENFRIPNPQVLFDRYDKVDN